MYMKKVFKIISICVFVGVLLFGMGACYWNIEREQTAVGVATAIWTRNGGDTRDPLRPWFVVEVDVEDEEFLNDDTTLGLTEALEFGLVAKAVLTREDHRTAAGRGKAVVTAYIWEFETPSDARLFVDAVNRNPILTSDTNVFKGRFAISSIRYPTGSNPDGTPFIGLIRTRRNDVDNLVGKFQWAVT